MLHWSIPEELAAIWGHHHLYHELHGLDEISCILVLGSDSHGRSSHIGAMKGCKPHRSRKDVAHSRFCYYSLWNQSWTKMSQEWSSHTAVPPFGKDPCGEDPFGEGSLRDKDTGSPTYLLPSLCRQVIRFGFSIDLNPRGRIRSIWKEETSENDIL